MIERKSSFLNFFNKPKHPPYFNGAVKGDAIPKYGVTDEKNRSYIEKMLDHRPAVNSYGYHTGFDVSGVKSRADITRINKVGRSQTVKQMLNSNYQKQIYSKNNRSSHYRSSASLTRESYLEDSKNYDEIFTPSYVNHNNYSDYTRKLLLLTSREPEGANKLKKSKSVKEVYNPEMEHEKNSNTFKRYVKSLKRRLTKSKKSDFQLTQKPQNKQMTGAFIKDKSEDKDVQSSSFIDSGINVSKNSPPQMTSDRVSRKDEFYKYDNEFKKSYGRLTKNDCGVSRKFEFKCDFEKVAPSPPKDKIDSGVETRENSKEKKLFSTSESEEQEDYVKRANTVQLSSNPYRTRMTKRAESKNRSLSPRRKVKLDKEKKFGSSINIWQQQERINEKIKKETEHHIIKTQKQQLNLLMNKTTKWVMTQNFEKYRGGEYGARHEDQVWTDG